jgi:hypothetical protein
VPPPVAPAYDNRMMEALLVALLGLGLGVLGHRLFHVALGLFGFVLGGALGLALVGPVFGPLLGLLAALVAGVVGLLVVGAVERAAFFLGGAAVGWVLGLAAALFLGAGALAPLVALVVAVIGGFVGLASERLAIVAGTALVGAWLTIDGVAAAVAGHPPDLHTLPLIGSPGIAELVLLGVAAGFAAIQLRGARSSDDG